MTNQNDMMPPAARRFVPRGGLVYSLASRMIDVIGAATGLLVVAPLLAILGLAAKRSTRGSAIFRQERLGKNVEPFQVLKLRTIPPGVPDVQGKHHADEYATRVGRFLRRYKLDELPQLWNVLKGQMAIVGPRPHPTYEWEDVSFDPRFLARPGLTSLWQLSRVRDEPFEKDPEYDLFYLLNRSLSFDLWLVWRTLLLLLLGKRTKIRLAARLWERDTSWRQLVPDRAKAIPRRTGLLRSQVWAMGFAAAVTLSGGSAAVMSFAARSDLVEGRQALLEARDAFRRLEQKPARTALSDAGKAFEKAEGKLTSWFTAPGRLLPVVRGNLEVATALARSGEELVIAGRAALLLIDTLPLENGRLVPPWKDGALDLKPFAAVAKPMEEVQAHLVRSQKILSDQRASFLLPPIAHARSEGLAALLDARGEADVASAASFLIPAAFGSERKRVWLIGAENTAELRGRGGYVGSLGVVEAENGRLQLKGFTATSELPRLDIDRRGPGVPEEYRRHYDQLGGLDAWQNLFVSPHFPSGARLLLSQLTVEGRPKADGIISMDPTALAYLLEVTGPVRVKAVPEPLTSENIVDWSLNRIYVQFERDNVARREVIGEVAEAVWQRLISGTNIEPRKLAEALGRALSERRLVVYSSNPNEQSLIEGLGIGGDVKEVRGDYLLVVAQNLGENKMDYYLEREVSYRGEVLPNGSISATLEVMVRNTASPTVPLPDYVGGARPHLDLGAREARNYLGVFVPRSAALEQISIEGSPIQNFDNRVELGKRLFGVEIKIKPGEAKILSFRYRVPKILVHNRYLLTIQNQATVRPDKFSVEVKVPSSAVIGLRQGFLRGTTLSWKGPLDADKNLAAEVGVPLGARILSEVAGFLRRPIGVLGR